VALLTADDLIAPNGPLETRDFPGDGLRALRTRITAYLAQAYADDRVSLLSGEPLQNKSARALTLYTAYLAMYKRMNVEPNQVNVTEEGSSTYTDAQRRAILDLANEQLAIVVGLQPVDEPVSTTRATPPTSARICLSF
jgi:hypothetical protein